MSAVYICDGIRTPFGRYGGSLSGIRPDDLAAFVLDALMKRNAMQTADVNGLADRAEAIYAELGKKIAKSGNGGSSESAVSQSVGTPALDGLGLVGGDFHTDHEWADLNSLVPRLYLLTRLLMDTGANPPSVNRSDAK